MIVLKGFSRFPIVYDHSGSWILPATNLEPQFKKYKDDANKVVIGSFVILEKLQNLQFKSRFVMEVKGLKRAINPQLKSEEFVPRYIYVFQDTKPDLTFENVFAMGITLKGGRKPVFVPLIVLRVLTLEEVNAFLNIVKVENIKYPDMREFLYDLGITVLREIVLANNDIVIKIQDPNVQQTYKLLISPNGKVKDWNFCMDTHIDFYLPEMVMLVRERRSLHILGGFHYD